MRYTSTPYLAKVLERCTDVVNGIIYDKESIERPTERLDFDKRGLSIMTFQILK